jgi:hypothetical protein
MDTSASFPRMLSKSIPGSTGSSARPPAPWRQPIAIGVGALGLALYNWWIPVALSGSLLTTPDELFSDLEASGRPDAALLQHLDLAAGLVLLVALMVRGPGARGLRRHEWPWLLAFALSGAVGGQFSYACPEGLSASCRAAEWRLALPHHHYVHVAAGMAAHPSKGVGRHPHGALDRTGSGSRLPGTRIRLPDRPLRRIRGADLLNLLQCDGGCRTAGVR